MTHQILSSCRTDTVNVIQDRMYLIFASQGAVILDGKTVGFILHAGDQFKSLAVAVDRDLYVIIVQASGAVPVIFYHTADRDVKIQLFQNAKCDIDLTAAVHHDQIRQFSETVILFFLRVTLVCKTSCQDFFHACVVVWPLHGFDTEFAVIASFWFAAFKDCHGSDRLETADIGNIIGFHSYQIWQIQPAGNFFHRPDCASFFSFDTIFVLSQDNLCILRGKLNQFFPGTFFRYFDVHLLPFSLSEPLF